MNLDSNFWIERPELKLVGKIKKLYEEDKSKNKNFSSKLMWSIYLIWDRRSEFFLLPEDGKDNKIDLVFNDFFPEGKEYISKKREELDELKSFYLMLQETPAQRALSGIEDKLVEREKFLKETKYDLGIVDEKSGKYNGGTADLIEKMLSNTIKIWEAYEKARKIVVQEMETSSLGNRESSLSDKGII